MAVTQGQPRVLTTECAQALPAGPFQQAHRSLQTGLRAWVEARTHHPLGYVEQLYTFADQDRLDREGRRVVSVSYLGLTREPDSSDGGSDVGWQGWYDYFPWEDRRDGVPAIINQFILPHLWQWADSADPVSVREHRRQRVAFTFGAHDLPWNEDMILQRYELLFEAKLLPEAHRRRDNGEDEDANRVPGQAMQHDHRRILATGIARVRAKIKYRPVMFELMPPEFTLSQLQSAVEALAGRELHAPNFRRLMTQQDLLEETGAMASGAPGRPARLYRYRGDVRLERAIAGTTLPFARHP